MTADSPRSWTTEIAARLRHLFWLKTLGTTAAVWLFFIGYFHLLRHPAYPVTVMPLTWLDGQVPFAPIGLVPYLSLWFYVGLAPGLVRDLRALLVYGLWAGALCLTGLAIFYFWPTQVPPIAHDTSAPGFALLQGIDAAGNACPSMHVAFSIFSAMHIHQTLRVAHAPALLRWLNAGWFVAIAWSTLAVRQHVALDVYAGAALGWVFAWASLRWRPADGPSPLR